MSTVKIITGDQVEFVVPQDVASQSGIIARMVDSIGDDEVTVPLQDIGSDTFRRVLAYFETGSFDAPPTDDDLLALVVAANFLDCKTLLDDACQAVADRIKGKSPEQIRQIFGLENTYTPEEEIAVRRANSWAFEP